MSRIITLNSNTKLTNQFLARLKEMNIRNQVWESLLEDNKLQIDIHFVTEDEKERAKLVLQDIRNFKYIQR